MILFELMNYMKNGLPKSYYETTLNELKQAKDSFFDINVALDKLKSTYEKYGKIIVAYDYDDTVCPSEPIYNCDNVVKLLRLCSKFDDFEMICFTARSTPETIEEVRDSLNNLGIRYDTINDNTDRIKKEMELTHPSKVLYGIFLDDKAGLGEAYRILVNFIEWYLEQQNIID